MMLPQLEVELDRNALGRVLRSAEVQVLDAARAAAGTVRGVRGASEVLEVSEVAKRRL